MMNLKYYREVDKLQDSQNFSIDFETHLLLALFLKPNQQNNDHRIILHNRLESQLRYINRKSVYVAMKWLIFMHQVIQNKPNAQILQEVSSLLDVMTSPATPLKIDEYIGKKLMVPYKQYLKKLADKSFLLQSSERNQNGMMASLVYAEYNFINWTLCEFSAPIREFTPFFASEYPCLARFVNLLDHDLSPLYTIVLKTFETTGIGMITFIEVEKMGARMIAIFGERQEKGKKDLLATADSSHQDRPEPINQVPIVPFFSLESSNLSLIPIRNK